MTVLVVLIIRPYAHVHHTRIIYYPTHNAHRVVPVSIMRICEVASELSAELEQNKILFDVGKAGQQ